MATEEILRTPPSDYAMIGGIGEGLYSNFYHELNGEILKRLEVEKAVAPHFAWDFWACVWKDHETGRWFEMVKRYHEHVDTIEGESAREVIEATNEKYGRE